MRKVLIAALAAAGFVAGVVPASATEHKEYIGVYWTYMNFSNGNAQGSNGAVLKAIWMDRATSSNPARWDGRIAISYDSNWTGTRPHENYWWRTCFETQSSKVLCGSWFHA